MTFFKEDSGHYHSNYSNSYLLLLLTLPYMPEESGNTTQYDKFFKNHMLAHSPETPQ